MDEQEFNRLLNLFPLVRSADYCADEDSSRQSTSRSAPAEEWQDAWDEEDRNERKNQGIDRYDAFWEKLKLAAERKVSTAEAERFCRAFQQVHQKLVLEELTLDAARNFINSSKGCKE